MHTKGGLGVCNNRSKISVIKIQVYCPIHDRALTTFLFVCEWVSESMCARLAVLTLTLAYSFVAYQFYMRHASDHSYLLSSAIAMAMIESVT